MRHYSKFLLRTKRFLADTAEFPTDTVRGIPDIEIRGNKECYINGCVTILEYSNVRIRFDGGSVTVTVEGEGLLLSELISGNMCVRGSVFSVSLEESL